MYPMKDRRGRVYTPAIGPRLKIVLAFIFALVALLGASGVYLLAVRLLEWYEGRPFTTQFSLWMFLAHVVFGVVAILPFLFFGTWHLLTARNRPNRAAVRLGLLLFIAGLLVVLSGVALIQLDGLPQLPEGTWTSPPRWGPCGSTCCTAAPVRRSAGAGACPGAWRWAPSASP